VRLAMKPQLAYFENLDTKEQMEVQFNPTDLSFSKTAQFAEIAIPGLDAPVLQFVRGGSETLTFELFFDTTDNGMAGQATSVTTLTEQFYRLVKQDPKTHAPPRCRLSWGPLEGISKPETQKVQSFEKPLAGKEISYAPFWFTCIVEAVDRKFILFSPEGIPLRARLTVKLREYQTVEQMASRLQSADHTKARVFKRRERFDQISTEEYGTPTEWRRIAAENNISNPLKTAPGRILRIPPLRSKSVFRRTNG